MSHITLLHHRSLYDHRWMSNCCLAHASRPSYAGRMAAAALLLSHPNIFFSSLFSHAQDSTAASDSSMLLMSSLTVAARRFYSRRGPPPVPPSHCTQSHRLHQQLEHHHHQQQPSAAVGIHFSRHNHTSGTARATLPPSPPPWCSFLRTPISLAVLAEPPPPRRRGAKEGWVLGATATT